MSHQLKRPPNKGLSHPAPIKVEISGEMDVNHGGKEKVVFLSEI